MFIETGEVDAIIEIQGDRVSWEWEELFSSFTVLWESAFAVFWLLLFYTVHMCQKNNETAKWGEKNEVLDNYTVLLLC